jgi:hypothetical protein
MAPVARYSAGPGLYSEVRYRLMGINTNTDLRIRPFLGDAVPMAELI